MGKPRQAEDKSNPFRPCNVGEPRRIASGKEPKATMPASELAARIGRMQECSGSLDSDLPFTNVRTEESIAQALTVLSGWLDRIFSPLVTLWVFRPGSALHSRRVRAKSRSSGTLPCFPATFRLRAVVEASNSPRLH